MKNLWPESFEENNTESAKNLFEEQAKLLTKITKGVVFAEVEEMAYNEAMLSNMKDDFSFNFNIKAKFLEGYSFKVLSFCHDITFYPVKLKLDSNIANELGIGNPFSDTKIESIESPEKLQNFVGKILNSDRIKKVIGSIIKLSK